MIIGDSWIVTAINTFLGMPFGLGYVVHYMIAIKSTAECSAVYHVFSFPIPQERNRFEKFPRCQDLVKDINPTNVTISAVYLDIGPQYI